jgi:hypothetical protein
MLPRRALARALAVTGVSGIVLSGFATDVALAAGTVSGVTPSSVLNTTTRTLTFTTSDTLLPAPAPAPTVTLTRSGTTDDTLTPTSVTPIPSGLGTKSVSATFDFTAANPGSYDVEVTQGLSDDTCAACLSITGYAPTLTSVTQPIGLGTGPIGMQPFVVSGQNLAKGPYAQCTAWPCPPLSIGIFRHASTTPDAQATLLPTATVNSNGSTTDNPTPGTATSITMRLVLADAPDDADHAYDDDIVVTNSDGKSSWNGTAAPTCACLHVGNQPRVTAVALAATDAAAIGLNATQQQLVISGQHFPTDAVVGITGPSGVSSPGAIHFTQSAPAVNGDHQEIVLSGVDTTQASATGTWTVRVSSPSLHNRSNGLPLTVTAAPTATSIAYSDTNSIDDVGQGAQDRHVTVNGENIQPGAHLDFTGLPAGVTIGDATTENGNTGVTVPVTVTQSAATGTFAVRIVNADGGTSGTCTTPAQTPPIDSPTPCPLTIAAGPSISSIAPNTVTSAYAGGLSVTGKNLHTEANGVSVTVGPAGAEFVKDYVGTAVANTDGTQTITIPSSAVTIPADATVSDSPVSVTNLDDGGTKTAASLFHITNLAVGGIAPTSATNDATLVGATITGSNFETGTGGELPTVWLHHAGVPDIAGDNVALTDSSTLTADFALTDAGPGLYQVFVQNPSTATHTGTAGTGDVFEIQGSDPVISTVSPDKVGGGASDYAITVTGSHFFTGSVVSFDGDPDISLVGAADVQSTTTIVQHIAVAPGAQAGAATVTVTNSAGVASNTANLTVDAAPLAVGVSPANHAPGTFSLSVAGSGFDPGATLDFSDPGVHLAGAPDVAGDGSTLTVDITVDQTVVPTDVPVDVQVTVVNSDGGRATTPEGHDLVVDPEPRVAQLTPASVAVGSSVPLQLHGANFLDGATLTAPGGSGIDLANVQVVDAGEIDATVTVASDATRGTHVLTLTNPDGGTVTVDLPVYVAPSAPAGLSVTPGDGSLTVSWSAPADNGGDAVSSYTVRVAPETGGGTPVSATTADGSTTDQLVTGLVNGTAYDVSVVATNGAGDGPAVNGAGTPRTVPSAPANLTVTPKAGELDLSWSAPADGGSPITGYTATVTPHGGTALAPHTLAASSTSDAFTGLTNGTAYNVSVVASNVVGDSTAATGAATPRTTPGAPTSLTVTPGNGTLSVSWAAPADNGGAAVSSYTATVTPHAGGAAQTFTSGDGTTTTHQFGALTNGVLYDVSVVATNAAGDSSATGAGTPRSVPAAPGNLVVTPGDGSLAVTWSAPADGGSPITGYTVTATPHGGTALAPHTLGASATSDSFPNLTNGTTYDVSVVANNAAGSSPAATGAGTPHFAVRLSIADSARHVVDGRKVTLSGALTRSDGQPVAGVPVVVLRTLDGKSARTFTTLTTDASGRWTATFAPAASGKVRTTVAPRVRIASPANKSAGSAATVLTVTGRVAPNKAGRVVTLYYVTSKGRLVKVATAKLSSRSTYRLTARLKRGTWHLRVVIAATPGNTAGRSVTLTVKRT